MCSVSTIEVLLFQHFDIYLLLRGDNFFCEKAPNMLLSVVGSRALFTNPQDHIKELSVSMDVSIHKFAHNWKNISTAWKPSHGSGLYFPSDYWSLCKNLQLFLKSKHIGSIRGPRVLLWAVASQYAFETSTLASNLWRVFFSLKSALLQMIGLIN